MRCSFLVCEDDAKENQVDGQEAGYQVQKAGPPGDAKTGAVQSEDLFVQEEDSELHGDCSCCSKPCESEEYLDCVSEAFPSYSRVKIARCRMSSYLGGFGLTKPSRNMRPSRPLRIVKFGSNVVYDL
jgi:hypothetical protein